VVLLTQTLPASGNAASIKPIGFSLCRADENMDPALASPQDLLASSPYEVGEDVAIKVDLEERPLPLLLVPSTFYPDQEASFELFLFVASAEEECPLALAPILAVEEVSAEEEEEPSPEESKVEEPVPEPEPTPEGPEQVDSKEEEPVPEPTPSEPEQSEPAEEPVPSPEHEPEVSKPVEPVEESVPESQPAESVVEQDAPQPSTEAPPPPPVLDTTPKAPAAPKAPKVPIANPPKRASTATGPDLFAQIQSGSFLRKVSEHEKTSYLKRSKTEPMTGFNMQMIINRRAAFAFSDSEDECSDHEDDDEWW